MLTSENSVSNIIIMELQRQSALRQVSDNKDVIDPKKNK